MRRIILAAVIAVVSTAGCQGKAGRTTAASEVSAPRIETGALNTAVVGSRVSIQGRVTRVQDDSPYGHKLWVDDGSGEARVFIDASLQLIRHTGTWRVGDELLVTGDVAKYQSSWELLPKAPANMVVVGRPDD